MNVDGPIRVFLDDEAICEAKDDTFRAGRVGLRAGQGHIMFDDVRVEGVDGELLSASPVAHPQAAIATGPFPEGEQPE